MSRRVTRSMSRKLEEETKADIIERISNLTPTERDNLNVTFEKAAIRIQRAHRLQNTRKKNQKNQKKQKELKKNDPLHNKKLLDLPIDKLYYEVYRICGIYGLNDNDIIKIIFTSIITSNTCNEFNMLLDNLFELNKKILEYIKESLSKIQGLKEELNIFNQQSNYGSSDEEEEINYAMTFNTNNIINEKKMIFDTLLKLLNFRDNILKEFNNILDILTKDYTKDSKNIKFLKDFIKDIDINWIDKIKDEDDILEVNSILPVLPETIKKIKEIFYDILNNKLIHTRGITQKKKNITLINDALEKWKSVYKEYLEYIKPKSKKPSKSKSRRPTSVSH
tara:strand:- start:72 stop:1079 length:1008 start_codon:yes stop_codon:yes gene_type:complete